MLAGVHDGGSLAGNDSHAASSTTSSPPWGAAWPSSGTTWLDPICVRSGCLASRLVRSDAFAWTSLVRSSLGSWFTASVMGTPVLLGLSWSVHRRSPFCMATSVPAATVVTYPSRSRYGRCRRRSRQELRPAVLDWDAA